MSYLFFPFFNLTVLWTVTFLDYDLRRVVELHNAHLLSQRITICLFEQNTRKKLIRNCGLQFYTQNGVITIEPISLLPPPRLSRLPQKLFTLKRRSQWSSKLCIPHIFLSKKSGDPAFYSSMSVVWHLKYWSGPTFIKVIYSYRYNYSYKLR
jgi:hypothetical protein